MKWLVLILSAVLAVREWQHRRRHAHVAGKLDQAEETISRQRQHLERHQRHSSLKRNIHH